MSEITPTFPLIEFDFYHRFEESFKNSLLGKMKSLLPLSKMAEDLGLYDGMKKGKSGRKSFFSPTGKIALAFLKMYTQLSAPKLMEALNSNIHYQLFCDILIEPEHPLTNYKLLDEILLEVAVKLDISKMQQILAESWKPYMKGLDTLYMDGTCYESEMRYPTDAKLLWECVGRAYGIMCEVAEELGVYRPRTKYHEVSKAVLGYMKQRKHKKAATRRIIRRELSLLNKILVEIEKLEKSASGHELMFLSYSYMLDIIAKVYEQQLRHFESGNAKESIPDRIVSISKPYIRPIVRGKENKNVEFGAKCNNILVDGISFIEHLSFNAFNEGTRLESSIRLSESLFGVKVTKVGGDQGYASNENRRFCTANQIVTSFVRKGKQPSETKKADDAIRKELAKVRATEMEGSFGTQKEHYSLRRNKARSEKTEILYIFLGIHASNAVRLAERIMETKAKAA